MSDPQIAELIDAVLKSYLIHIPENQGLHGWRCQYPQFGPCDHYEELLNELTKLVEDILYRAGVS